MRFLVLQHVPHEGPGLLAEGFAQEGITLEVAEVWRRPDIPGLEGHDALIVMGGPMGVQDPESAFPTRAAEMAAIEAALQRDIPFLGICLGSQLLATALGARVYPNPAGKEIGMTRVAVTGAGRRDPLFCDLGDALDVLEWHGDCFDAPPASALLATGERCANQALVYGRAYGLLFHLEMPASMVEGLAAADHAWINTPQPTDVDALLAAFRKSEAGMRAACLAMAARFAGLARQSR